MAGWLAGWLSKRRQNQWIRTVEVGSPADDARWSTDGECPSVAKVQVTDRTVLVLVMQGKNWGAGGCRGCRVMLGRFQEARSCFDGGSQKRMQRDGRAQWQKKTSERKLACRWLMFRTGGGGAGGWNQATSNGSVLGQMLPERGRPAGDHERLVKALDWRCQRSALMIDGRSRCGHEGFQ